MIGSFVDVWRLKFRKLPADWKLAIKWIETDFGKIRVLDTQTKGPVLLNVPDGPNVIEHHEAFIKALSKNFRVICFELPGFGFSFPTIEYDFSLDKSAQLILQIMDTLQLERASLSFSCANGFYAIKVAALAPDKFEHLFLAQTPGLTSMKAWVENVIPKTLTYPVIGQLANIALQEKFAKNWYRYALPKTTDKSDYQKKAIDALNHGACFCLSGLVQGLSRELHTKLKTIEVPASLIWGNLDFTHKNTNCQTIKTHLPECEIVEFANCGHFPELEDTNRYVKYVAEKLLS